VAKLELLDFVFGGRDKNKKREKKQKKEKKKKPNILPIPLSFRSPLS
jgi:hypothetical protein